jgi:hypothetical protein
MFKITGGVGKAAAFLAKFGVGFFSTQGAPTNGTAGSFFGLADKGSVLGDQTNGIQYINIGTKASPTWVPVPQTASLAITNAQAKVIRATPLPIVPAPGVGRIVVPIAAYCGLVYGGTNAFTAAVNDNLGLKYKDGTGVSLLTGAVQAFLQATVSSLSLFVPAVAAGSTVNITKANSENQPLVVHNITAAEIAGNAANDNTLIVTVTYVIIASGL